MNDVDVIPRRELLRYLRMRLFICCAKISERLPRKHDSPPKRIVRPIPLIDPDLMRRISLLHQDRKIQPRRPPTNDVDLHVSAYISSKAFCNRSLRPSLSDQARK